MDPAPLALCAYVDGATPAGTASVLAGIGVSLADEQGELFAIARPVAATLCIAYLEHLAILTALEIAAEIGAREITVHCDSSNVVSRITHGRARRGCADIRHRVRLALTAFERAFVVFIDGEQNERAHRLARSATYAPLDTIRWRKSEEVSE